MSDRERVRCRLCRIAYTKGKYSIHILENEHRRYLEHANTHVPRRAGCDWCDDMAAAE